MCLNVFHDMFTDDFSDLFVGEVSQPAKRNTIIPNSSPKRITLRANAQCNSCTFERLELEEY